MPTMDQETKDKKHKDLLKAYFLLLKKYGPTARHISRKQLYYEAAEAVYMSSGEYAGKIIRQLLSERRDVVVEVEKEIAHGSNRENDS